MRNPRSSSVLRNLSVAAIALAASAVAADPKALVVTTAEGAVQGTRSGGIDRFLGIPYAAAPVGDLRWQPPQPYPAWNGVRDATRYANHCPQAASPYGLPSTTEDCLFLNVFTPVRGDEGWNGDARLPVMVWIHGGALNLGESDDYDPTQLVREGIVVVTINYRLGMLGFLSHPALSAESGYGASGNYGLMDQQAALRWVQRNIARFGGDAERVTIFGESAGGLSTHSHLASPGSAGLFHRAIVESGAYTLSALPLAVAHFIGTGWATAAGCASQTAACLRAAPVAALIAAVPITTSVIPTIDGKVLTKPFAVTDAAGKTTGAFAEGDFNRVPVIEGSNHDEYRLFTAPLSGVPLQPSEYVGAIAATLRMTAAQAAGIAALYPLANYPNTDTALAAVATDAVFACNARKAVRVLSGHVPVYGYEFNDENAPELFLPAIPPSVENWSYGAAHASEIQYLFGLRATVPAPSLDSQQRKLSRTMIEYWTTFARTGSPNGASTPFWPRYDPAADVIQSLLPPKPVLENTFAADHKCAIWTPLP